MKVNIKGRRISPGIPLRRVIGPATAIFLVAGNMIGSGVFKKISPMSAALRDSHGILLAWALAGIVLSALSGIPVYYYYRKRKDEPEGRIPGPGSSKG